ncbi:hypothetical protein O6H91_12G065500 [Diphasiastrum complanatum]|uniref:Uncharacterized protein n=1 Tax=Diphasiastrum complanatum TaxID=34168 RepID=A0ACC2C3E8_DIPCM|nr:hypothetical protein O6H91_12G065500 [Diphasiastrum complanatum]
MEALRQMSLLSCLHLCENNLRFERVSNKIGIIYPQLLHAMLKEAFRIGSRIISQYINRILPFASQPKGWYHCTMVPYFLNIIFDRGRPTGMFGRCNALLGNLQLPIFLCTRSHCGGASRAYSLLVSDHQRGHFNGCLVVDDGGTFTSGADVRKLCQEGHLDEALKVMESMDLQGLPISRDNAYYLLQGCTKKEDISAGRRVYSLMMNSGLDSVSALSDHLIRLFALGGKLKEANEVFWKVSEPSVFTWSAIISANSKLGQGDKALDLYRRMQASGVKSNSYIYVAVLNACARTQALSQGKLIHEKIIKSGFHLDMVVGNALVDMYSKCGSLEDARKVFNALPNRDIVSWNTMIRGYSQNGYGQEVLRMYATMQQSAGIKLDNITYASILKACSSMADLGKGRQIHAQMVRSGIKIDTVIRNTLIDMYGRCGSLQEALKEFQKLPNPDIVSWNSMIAAYVLHEHAHDALRLYEEMLQTGAKPDSITFASILKACGETAAIGQGRRIHAQAVRVSLHLDSLVGTTLVDMYARCGSLDEARQVFDRLPNRGVVSWGAMIAGYARVGDCRLAQQCLEDMQAQGLKPDKVIFISILAACSHKGLVEEGKGYFKSMSEHYGISPGIEHYSCMVDLLGRAGKLDEAEHLLQTMPMSPDIVGWGSLLTACKTYGDVERGRRCFDELMKLDSRKASGYVLMANIYADAHMWTDAYRIEYLRRSAGAWKKPARAWIEVNNKVHGFLVGDKSHPQTDSIYSQLKRLSCKMKEQGYIPKIDSILKQVSDEDKEDSLCGHVEKLAIAFGLLSTPQGTTIRAAKNLRVCTDCHTATKIISKLENREIVIRDAYRLHHFKDGACSCEDFY